MLTSSGSSSMIDRSDASIVGDIRPTDDGYFEEYTVSATGIKYWKPLDPDSIEFDEDIKIEMQNASAYNNNKEYESNMRDVYPQRGSPYVDSNVIGRSAEGRLTPPTHIDVDGVERSGSYREPTHFHTSMERNPTHVHTSMDREHTRVHTSMERNPTHVHTSMEIVDSMPNVPVNMLEDGTYTVCFNCNEEGCDGGCISVRNDRESKSVQFTVEQTNGGQPANPIGRTSGRTRLSSPFASGAQDKELVLRKTCDENLQNCRELSRTYESGNLPEGVDRRESVFKCEDGNVCVKIDETDVDSSGRSSRTTRDASGRMSAHNDHGHTSTHNDYGRTSTHNDYRSSGGVVKTYGALQLIEPQPLAIEPYTVSDTNMSVDMLSFANAPGMASYAKPRRKMGEWLVWGTYTCSYCTLVKKMLSDANQTIYFLDRDTASAEQKRWIENKGINIEGTVPVVMLNGSIIGGSEKLKDYLDKA